MRKSLSETFAHLFHPRRSNNHRPHILHPEALVAMSVMVLLVSLFFEFLPQAGVPLGKVLGYASSITPSEVVRLTNQRRSEAGLKPLILNAQLSNAALAKGQDMMTDQYWAHTAPDGTQPWAFISGAGYRYRVAGENLARDFNDTPSMMGAWMASPTHRANVLSSKYTEIGIGVIDGVLEGYETTLVVQMFGSPQLAAANEDSKPGQVASETTLSEAQFAEDVYLESIGPETQAEPQAEDSNQLIAVQPAPNSENQPGQPAVLASALIPFSDISPPPLFSPLQLTKALLLALVMVMISTLVYDTAIAGDYQTVRLVGKNMAHLCFLGTILFLLLFFKGGIIN